MRDSDMRTAATLDRDAEIYRSISGELVRFATALVGPDEAADVVSTVVVRVLSKRRLADLDEPRPYLYRAVLNEARSNHRRTGRVVVGLPATLPAAPGAEDHGEVVEAVRRLPQRQRAATYLVYWMGCTTAEAAQLMGARTGTVGRYLHLARKNMRRVLDA
ncbi:MAG TPA: sigma-70 family RNA polymerase sigma factor [Acidimicrobiia bacterium]|nr:sigma-70 family RNA polymerase sigma factor [Acidimicrobiia bacterium]